MKKKLPIYTIILVCLIAILACTNFHPVHKIQDILSAEHTTSTKAPAVYYHDRVVVLLYHNFKNKECGTAITPARFKQHLDMLEKGGFNVVSLQDIMLFLNGQHKLPPNAVAITMDDGYKSNYTIAYKELKKRHWPGAIFVIIKNTKDAGSKNDEWLTWNQLRTMSNDNMAIMSHSFNGHRFIKGQYPKGEAWLTTPLSGETPVLYQQRIYNDLLKARTIMQKQMGIPIVSFALPFGMYNQDVIDMAQKAGYKYIWTTVREAVTASSKPTELPRVSVGRQNTTAQQLKETIITIGER